MGLREPQSLGERAGDSTRQRRCFFVGYLVQNVQLFCAVQNPAHFPEVPRLGSRDLGFPSLASGGSVWPGTVPRFELSRAPLWWRGCEQRVEAVRSGVRGSLQRPGQEGRKETNERPPESLLPVVAGADFRAFLF